MQPNQLFTQGLAFIGPIVSSVEPHQWSLPTPCEKWTVLDVLGHLGESVARTSALLEGETPVQASSHSPGHAVSADPHTWWDDISSRAQAAAAHADPQLATEALTYATIDLFVHGWDISAALGEPVELSEAAVTFAQQALANTPVAQLRDENVFATAFPFDDQSPSAALEFLAWTGRDPHWQPPKRDQQEVWEQRYQGSERLWSGKVNAPLQELVATLVPGTALDLGCGEGGDVIWLAQQGWHATGVDIAQTAIDRATEDARNAGVSERTTWERVDLSSWEPQSQFDLVTCSFLHTPPEVDRDGILRRSSQAVAPGGYLLVLSHANRPDWSHHRFEEMPSLAHEIGNVTGTESEQVGKRLGGWDVSQAHTTSRQLEGPEGQQFEMINNVVLLRRLPEADAS